MKIRSALWMLVISVLLSATLYAQKAPAPYGAIPTQRQLDWQEMEMYVLMHFTPTTFQNKEWGFGDADPAIFNPVKFDADKIVAAVKAGGFKGFTVVAKHHDGFALWPTKTTPYNISASPFRNGKGDLVKEMMEAVHKAGLKFGLYCSPWDRNNPNYSRPEYIQKVYYPQLNELYSNYGKLFTVFFDGANGGDGYYGGTRERRKIEPSTYYNYDTIWTMVRSKQPSAAIFSDIGPDIRWVGNEHGEAGPISWSTLTPKSPDPSRKPSPGFSVDKELPQGTRNGQYWIPAECDVPLRAGWFYHPEQDGNSRNEFQLLDIYYKSVGRSGCLDLGISPMPSGELNPEDIEKLRRFGELIKKTFAVNYVKGASVQASNTRAGGSLFAAKNLLDEDRYSYWATDDAVKNPELVLTLAKESVFNVIRLRENIKLGQRIEGYALDQWKDGAWKEIATGSSIGGNKLIRLSEYISTKKIRLRITASPVCIALSDLALFAEPQEVLSENKKLVEKKYDAKKEWSLVAGNAKAAIDGNPETIATLDKMGMISIDLGKVQAIHSIEYLPRQDGGKAGLIDQYIYETSTDGKTFTVVAEGEFSNIVNNPVGQFIQLKNAPAARYVRMTAKRTVDGHPATVAEINIR